MLTESTYSHTEEMHNTRAASFMVPYIVNLFKPSSVLDVGCGLGTWLYEFKKAGVTEVLGIDSPFVNKDLLSKFLEAKEFLAFDLTKPFNISRKFDLALSLELAEHLPPRSALQHVDDLTSHADLIIFSAAIPAQFGQNHTNEQWQSYWAEKFFAKGYKCYDLIRPHFWNNQQVDFWYKQNMLVYSKHELPFLQAITTDIIHPDAWSKQVSRTSSLKSQLSRVKSGKVGLSFYLKAICTSLLHFGKKINS